MSTQSSAERERAFRDALKAMCEQYGAEIEITDDGMPYGMQSGVMIVTMQPVYEGDECVKKILRIRTVVADTQSAPLAISNGMRGRRRKLAGTIRCGASAAVDGRFGSGSGNV